MPKKILITGAAGFIGMHVCNGLIKQNYNVVGIDNINSYYDTSLKYDRLAELGIQKDKILYNQKNEGLSKFSFLEIDLSDAGSLMTLFSKEKFDIVINLAAQAGVRYSITNPRDYINSNIVGFFNLLEACRTYPIKHLIYASSSSVYGNNKTIPFSTDHKTDEPISLYAATKKSNELMAYTYAHLYRIPATGLRFFTVYGPWGRPDMAYFSFTKSIVERQEIKLYNHGNLKRDFTYVDDIVKAISALIPKSPADDENKVPHRVLNIGNQNPVDVITFVNLLEELIGKKARIKNMPMQPGDVAITYADTSAIQVLTGFTPNTPLKTGLKKFVSWYKNYANKI
jgi:UDP-glucuronate 4-epimerase